MGERPDGMVGGSRPLVREGDRIGYYGYSHLVDGFLVWGRRLTLPASQRRSGVLAYQGRNHQGIS